MKLFNRINQTKELKTLLYLAGTDDSVPASALERVAGCHEGQTVHQTGGGAALQPQDVGRRHAVHDGHRLDVQGAGAARDHRHRDEADAGGAGDGQEVWEGVEVPQGEEGHPDVGRCSGGVSQEENWREIGTLNIDRL